MVEMQSFILVICVDSVESAVAAERGGATRLELCQNLMIGGTTPGIKLFEAVREEIHIPIQVLIRPRFGDFCYTDYEWRIMKEEIRMFRDRGADGIVIGMLKPDGILDRDRMEALLEERGGMSVTLHRAFDVCKEPMETLAVAKTMGIQTILTSGQKNTCMEGTKLLAALQQESQGEICIQAGGGVTPEGIESLYRQTGICAYHMSAKEKLESAMTYRNRNVHMGLAKLSEYEIYRTSGETVRRAREVLKRL